MGIKSEPSSRPLPHMLVPDLARHKYRPQNARVLVLRTHLLSIQLLIRRPRWPTRVLCLSKQLDLPLIALRILLVAPFALEPQPARRLAVERLELILLSIKLIEIRRKNGIPVRALLGVVFEDAAGQVEVRDRVVVGAAHSVVRVRAFGGVRDGAAGRCLFDGGPREGLAICVLGEPHGLRDAVGEAHHGVFPVADVVAEVEGGPAEDFAAVVVGVKVHVEGVDVAVAFVGDDDGGSDGVVGFAVGVGFGALDPVGVLGNIVVGGEVDVGAELVDVVLGEGLGRPGDFVEVDLRSGVVEEDFDVGRHILVSGVEVDHRSCALLESGWKDSSDSRSG
jgi:hypothetical protein